MAASRGSANRPPRTSPSLFSRISLLRADRLKPFPPPLRQFVLFLFSAISAIFGAATLHCEELRNQPVTATKPALTRPAPMLYKQHIFTAIPR
jgi:hypothetical protein